jgi:hypothetical protein
MLQLFGIIQKNSANRAWHWAIFLVLTLTAFFQLRVGQVEICEERKLN